MMPLRHGPPRRAGSEASCLLRRRGRRFEQILDLILLPGHPQSMLRFGEGGMMLSEY